MRDLGLLAFLASFLLVALAVAWGRTPWGKGAIFAGRYTSMAAPLLYLTYFITELSGPRRFAPLARSVLYTLVVAAASQNMLTGKSAATAMLAEHMKFRKDMAEGEPISLLVKRHYMGLNFFQDRLQHYLKAVHDAGCWPYRDLRPDPPMRELRIPVAPAQMAQVVRQGRSWRATGDDPSLDFDLDRPTFVRGLRITFSHESSDGQSPYFQVQWRACGEQEFTEDRSYAHFELPTSGQTVEVPVWIYETIDQIRICPDKRPCRFSIAEIVLLLPP